MENMTRLDPVGSLWSKAWKIYSDRFGLLIGILLPPMVLVGLADIFKTLSPHYAIPSALATLVGYVILIPGVTGALSSLRNNTDFGNSYRAGWKLFWPILWVGVLTLLTGVGSFVMLLLPAIWIGIAMSFSNYAVIFEGKRGMSALLHSFSYVKGYWWAVFGRIFLQVAVLVICYIIVDIPFGIVGRQTGTAVGSSIVALFFTPFSLVYNYCMYENLVALKPSLAESNPTDGKTFMRIAQIVGIVVIIAIILLVVGFVVGVVKAPTRGELQNTYVPPPGSYGGQ
ncbi:MAG TPA: hypothetical protein VMU07_00660 [Candidatus Paceibacterota bacterium]|nr:hypothetical protein [Candidatus Paceibacterota bacterium]